MRGHQGAEHRLDHEGAAALKRYADVRILACGKAPGILTPNEADARHWLECGALFVAVGADVGILARGAEALAAKFKKP